MPVHLSPHDEEARGGPRPTRREFLARAAAGLLVAGGAGRLLSDAPAAGAPPGKGSDARVWALLADTHIPALLTEQNRDFHMASNLVKTVADALAENPALALVNGDMARLDGKPGDYASFIDLVEPFRRAGVPLHATLGNHDDRGNFRAAVTGAGLAPASVTEKQTGAVDAGPATWFLLDSLEKVNSTPGHLGKDQIDWLVRELDRDTEKPACLFLHHNPEKTNIGLKDTDDLLQAIRPRRRVKAVFFGHTHTWKRWEDEGIHMVNLPATAYAFSEGEPTGWVLARARPDGLEIELRAIGAAHADHGKKLELRWRS
jgi:Icc protein